MRTVEIQADTEKLAAFMINERYKATQEAIGYLSMWSYPSYNKVSILFSQGRDPEDVEFVAHYQQTEDVPTRSYVIGAIWHPEEKRFSFHS